MIETALLIGAYGLGAIPFGVIVARSKGVDLFQVGSGNVGATNVSRALGTGPALMVFALDVLKGVGPALAARFLLHSPEWALGVGMAAIAGHCFSPFLRFRGGKGVATGLGALLGSTPLAALSVLAVFVVSLVVCRWVSLSSLLAAVALVFFGWLYGDSALMLAIYGIFALFLFYRHRANLKRLRDGTEPKFKFKREIPSRNPPSAYQAEVRPHA